MKGPRQRAGHPKLGDKIVGGCSCRLPLLDGLHILHDFRKLEAEVALDLGDRVGVVLDESLK